MGTLWKKESDSVDAQFVDLFIWENDDAKPYDVWEWDRKIKSGNWKHEFQRTIDGNSFSAEPVKSNAKSDYCLARADGTRIAHFDIKASFRPGLMGAIEMYNKCLRFAESGSKNISVAYANRAICHLYTDRYSDCLKDIELAIAANHPAELLPDLMVLKKECEEKLEKTKDRMKTPWYIQNYGGNRDPKLNFRPHDKFPCMADVLEIQEDEEFGRHIVAKCDISIGKTVLIEENYMSQYSRNYWDRTHCYTCLRSTRSFIACPKCTDVMFCNETCLNQNEFHQKFCGENFERMPNHVKFIIKSILIGIGAFESVDEMMGFVESTLAIRETQLPEAANDTKTKYALFLNLQPPRRHKFDVVTAYQVYHGLLDIPSIKDMFDSQQRQRFLMHLAAEHVSIISSIIVAQEFCYNINMNRRGVNTFANVYLLFNHSCDPNVFNFTMGTKVVCITIRPIKKGEQLFVKYWDNEYQRKPYSTAKRQEILLRYWRFLCKCSKCESSCKPKYCERMKMDENYKFLLEANKKYYEEFNSRSRTEVKTKCVEFLEKYSHLPWSKEIEFVSELYSRCLRDDYPKSFDYY